MQENDDECVAEFIDGSWTWDDCMCEACEEQGREEAERSVEFGQDAPSLRL